MLGFIIFVFFPRPFPRLGGLAFPYARMGVIFDGGFLIENFDRDIFFYTRQEFTIVIIILFLLFSIKS